MTFTPPTQLARLERVLQAQQSYEEAYQEAARRQAEPAGFDTDTSLPKWTLLRPPTERPVLQRVRRAYYKKKTSKKSGSANRVKMRRAHRMYKAMRVYL